MARISPITLTILAASLIHLVVGTIRFVSPNEWANYKAAYNKTYSSILNERNARFFYAVNTKLIENHNAWYNAGAVTYRLGINQFTDMRFIDFNAMFPLAQPSRPSNENSPPIVQPASPSYDPRKVGIKLKIEDQGVKCNSGWAYAAAKSIEIFKAAEMGNMNSSLSAQNLIDCAGQMNGCYNQIPQAAFEYLTRYKRNLYFENDYKNDIFSSKPGMCTPPDNVPQLPVVNLTAYSKIKDYDDESLKAHVSAGMPVVVEFNPASFQFMHYLDGVFQQPVTGFGSHFMVVIGYGTDNSTKMNYWLLQNSFGTSWGIGGLMKLQRTPYIRIAKNAIFPSES